MIAGALAVLAALAAGDGPKPGRIVRVVVWDEQQAEQDPTYPNFLGNWIAENLTDRPACP